VESRKQKTIGVVIAIISLAFLASIFLFSAKASPTGAVVAGKLQKIRVAVNPVLVAGLPVYLADEKGFWKEEGLDVEVLNVGTGPLQLQAVSAGAADFAGTVAEYPLVFAQVKETSLRFLTVYEKDPYFVVARKSSGISSLEDLKGKKIGVRPQTTGDYYFRLLMSKRGWNESDFTLVSIEPKLFLEALSGRNIDAFVWLMPHPIFAERAFGDDAIVFEGSALYKEFIGMIGRKDFLEKNPEVGKKLVAGLKKAIEWMKENPVELFKFVEKKLGLSREEAEYAFKYAKFGINATGLVEAFNAESVFAAAQGLIPEFRNKTADEIIWGGK
jgi:NitT/TauT family transport system substrate-binding protein